MPSLVKLGQVVIKKTFKEKLILQTEGTIAHLSLYSLCELKNHSTMKFCIFCHY